MGVEEVMDLINDQSYLRKKQYRSADKLEARIELHRRFGREETPWTRWLMEKLPLQAGSRVLDIGCGPGTLWEKEWERIPGVEVVLADLSFGMVRAAQGELGGHETLRLMQSDAQNLPLADNSVDLGLANHMLYHVPDIRRGLAELRRVIRPGGWFCAATNGKEHMKELNDLVARYLPEHPTGSVSARRFGLEQGGEMAEEFFADVQVLPREDDLWVTETRALVNYVLSMWGTEDNCDDSTWLQRLTAEVDETIRIKGGFRIGRVSGVILGRKL